VVLANTRHAVANYLSNTENMIKKTKMKSQLVVKLVMLF